MKAIHRLAFAVFVSLSSAAFADESGIPELVADSPAFHLRQEALFTVVPHFDQETEMTLSRVDVLTPSGRIVRRLRRYSGMTIDFHGEHIDWNQRTDGRRFAQPGTYALRVIYTSPLAVDEQFMFCQFQILPIQREQVILRVGPGAGAFLPERAIEIQLVNRSRTVDCTVYGSKPFVVTRRRRPTPPPVFGPDRTESLTVVPAGESRTWTWDQKNNAGELILSGGLYDISISMELKKTNSPKLYSYRAEAIVSLMRPHLAR